MVVVNGWDEGGGKWKRQSWGEWIKWGCWYMVETGVGANEGGADGGKFVRWVSG